MLPPDNPGEADDDDNNSDSDSSSDGEWRPVKRASTWVNRRPRLRDTPSREQARTVANPPKPADARVQDIAPPEQQQQPYFVEDHPEYQRVMHDPALRKVEELHVAGSSMTIPGLINVKFGCGRATEPVLEKDGPWPETYAWTGVHSDSAPIQWNGKHYFKAKFAFNLCSPVLVAVLVSFREVTTIAVPVRDLLAWEYHAWVPGPFSELLDSVK